jgi:hypothetical protein
MDLRFFSPDMLESRVKSMVSAVINGQMLQALKIIRATIYNLENTQMVGMPAHAVDYYKAALNGAALYANREDAHSLMSVMTILQKHLEVYNEPKIAELPHAVRSCIEEFVA